MTLSLFIPAEEDGELGTFASFESSNFTRNFASIYGAAIGATALNLFESKGETRPGEISNWYVFNKQQQQ